VGGAINYTGIYEHGKRDWQQGLLEQRKQERKFKLTLLNDLLLMV